MANWTHFYLIRIEFLGFRYSGWQKQPGVRTVHLMVDKTVEFVLQHTNFKTLGCGRTDAKVSADDYAFELFCMQELESDFLERLNQCFPSDIKALSIEATNSDFNILQNQKVKEYHYHFCFGEKANPLSAPFIVNVKQNLNLERMQKGARVIQGTHNFRRFTSKPGEETQLEREIMVAEVLPSNKFQGNIFPKEVYMLRIKSKGFLRYQIRMLMGTLFALGSGEINETEYLEYFQNPEGDQVRWIAPGSGLCLHKVVF
ncbi:MAG: tRNA pseudouridine(38-40) synthase TruA [Crocinitomicaceae bacterium]